MGCDFSVQVRGHNICLVSRFPCPDGLRVKHNIVRFLQLDSPCGPDTGGLRTFCTDGQQATWDGERFHQSDCPYRPGIDCLRPFCPSSPEGKHDKVMFLLRDGLS